MVAVIVDDGIEVIIEVLFVNSQYIRQSTLSRDWVSHG
jgi:hypothetical protein